MRDVLLGTLLLAGCGDDGAPHVRVDSVVAVADSAVQECVTCDDDSSLEPNDSIAMARAASMDALDGLAICATGDKDYYSVDIATPTNLEMLVLYEAAGVEVRAALLSEGGVALAEATTSSTRTKRAFLPNLPIGTYYVEVAAVSSGTNNYRLRLTLGP